MKLHNERTRQHKMFYLNPLMTKRNISETLLLISAVTLWAIPVWTFNFIHAKNSQLWKKFWLMSILMAGRTPIFACVLLCIVCTNTQGCLPRKMTACHYGHLTEPVTTTILSPCTSTLCLPAWQHSTSPTNITSPCTWYIHSELHPLLFKRCPESIAFQILNFRSLMQCSQQTLIKPSCF